MQEHGLQCGFCTPGMMMTSARAPREEQEPPGGRDPPRHLRQPLPVHRLREHRQGRAARGREAAVREGIMSSTPRTSPEVGGMGHSMKRKEDPRFIRGQGNYVDDVVLPGMLYMDIVRSPYAHAKIKKIDTAAALKVPGVLAVITGETLAQYKLHWMPTLMSDTQMVLPVEKVMYQAQEVAAVIATDRYAAADGVAAVEVDYDPLPVIVDPFKALEPGRPGAAHGQARQEGQPHLPLGGRRPRGHRQGLKDAAAVVKQRIYIPRIHVASIETCGCVASFDKTRRQAHGLDDHPGAACHPHRVRAGGRPRGAVGGEDPHHLARHRRRLRRQGARLSRLRDRGGGLRRDRQARQVDRGPHGEPPGRLLRPRLPHRRRAGRGQGRQDHGPAHQDPGRPRLRGRRRQPVQVPGRALLGLHRLLRHQERLRRGGRRLHEQGAGRHRLPLLVPRHRGRPRHRAHDRHAGAGAEDGPGRVPAARTSSPRTSSPTSRRWAGSTTAATTRGALRQGHGDDRLRRPAQGAGREARAHRNGGQAAPTGAPGRPGHTRAPRGASAPT